MTVGSESLSAAWVPELETPEEYAVFAHQLGAAMLNPIAGDSESQTYRVNEAALQAAADVYSDFVDETNEATIRLLMSERALDEEWAALSASLLDESSLNTHLPSLTTGSITSSLDFIVAYNELSAAEAGAKDETNRQAYWDQMVLMQQEYPDYFAALQRARISVRNKSIAGLIH